MNGKHKMAMVLGAATLGFGLLSGAAVADEEKDQKPAYQSSIQVKEQHDGEQGEAAKLAALAKINATQATAAALGQVPGTVLKVELDNENGNVVYGVKVKTLGNEIKEVKVDAGNGRVLHVDSDDEDNNKEGNDKEE